MQEFFPIVWNAQIFKPVLSHVAYKWQSSHEGILEKRFRDELVDKVLLSTKILLWRP